MGFPANKGLTVTTGTLNAVCVTIRNNCYLVSSADIDGGNSGGPLMTTQGNIIGHEYRRSRRRRMGRRPPGTGQLRPSPCWPY